MLSLKVDLKFQCALETWNKAKKEYRGGMIVISGLLCQQVMKTCAIGAADTHVTARAASHVTAPRNPPKD